jgi:hypothetical protein
MQTETRAEIESSASLIDEQLVKLTPGRVRTDRDYRAFDSFTVPPGWYGHQRGGGYMIGKELNGLGVAFESGGISIEPLGDRFSRSLAYAARAFEKLRDIRIEHVSPVRIGGNSGRRYSLVVDKSVSRPLRAEAILRLGETEVILLDVPGDDTNNLIIRWGFDDDRERAEVERVLMSFEFHRPSRLAGGRAHRQQMGRPLFGSGGLVRRSRPELDPLDAQDPRLVGLVSIPRPDDRLGSFAAGDDRDGFLG